MLEICEKERPKICGEKKHIFVKKKVMYSSSNFDIVPSQRVSMQLLLIIESKVNEYGL